MDRFGSLFSPSGKHFAHAGALAFLRPIARRWVKEIPRDIFWHIYGRKIRNPSFARPPCSVLFICKGNICRSAFAQYFSVKTCRENLSRGARFLSAGLEAKPSDAPPRMAISAAKRFGVDMRYHRPTMINADLVESVEMVVAMEVYQAKNIERRFPEAQSKVILLPLFDPEIARLPRGYHRYNIQDPYGKAESAFLDCFHRIERCLANLCTHWNTLPEPTCNGQEKTDAVD